jgi:calmodulin
MDFPDPDGAYADDYGGGEDDYGAPPPGAMGGGARGFDDDEYGDDVQQYDEYDAPEQLPPPAAAAASNYRAPPPTTAAPAGGNRGPAASSTAAGAGRGAPASEYPADYIEAFQIYDKDYGDDAISAGMLGTVLRALGQNPTEGQLAELVQTIGKDIYTVADVDFILRNYDLRDQCSPDEIKDMWDMVAGPGQTFVQKTVLQGVLSKIGDKIFEQDFNKIMMAANVGGDVVTFDQFQRIMTN